MVVLAARPPTHDAGRCLQQFFEFLELSYKTRVRDKIGKTLDWVHLSNLSTAAAAHPTKPRTPLVSSSRSKQRDASFVVSSEQRQQLRAVFIHYCSWGEKQNFISMRRTQFLHCARGTGLVGAGKLDTVAVNLLFEKMAHSSDDVSEAGKLSLATWTQALAIVATRIYGHLEAQEAFNKLIEEHIAHHKAQAAPADDVLSDVVLREEVLAGMDSVRAQLQPVFDHYIQDQAFGDSSKTLASWGDMASARAQMPLDSFIRFCLHFEITPTLLTKAQLAKAFKAAKFGAGRQSLSTDPLRVTFQEFLDCLARCALLAYNYTCEPIAAVTMTFGDSYATDAKRLWLQETERAMAEANEGMDFQLPPAMSEYASSSDEDRPPQPSYRGRLSTAASMVSRAGINRISTIHFRSQTIDTEGGAETMTVHADPTALRKPDQPLHLAHFTPDWVAAPGQPLGETARLKRKTASRGTSTCRASAGEVTTSLPPILQQRMEQMVGARTARQQALELLRLQYNHDRRQAQRQAGRDATWRRQQLTAATGLLNLPTIHSSASFSDVSQGGRDVSGQLGSSASRGFKGGASKTLLRELQDALGAEESQDAVEVADIDSNWR